MHEKAARRGWLDLGMGFVAGLVAAAVGFGVLNLLVGWRQVSAWERAIDQWHADELEHLMLRQISVSRKAIEDDQPLRSGENLAFSVTPEIYQHYLDHCMYLLEHDQVVRFNQLRGLTSQLRLDLSGAGLANLNLAGADFGSALVKGTDFRGADLSGASFYRSDLSGADLSGARVEKTSFSQAEMLNAKLNGIFGAGADFSQAVLVNASLTGINGLEDARFDSAELAQCNLQGSRFPGAVFDRAGFTLASAVNTDFSAIKSMNSALMTGANLTGTRWSASALDRPWLVGAQGLDAATIEAMRSRGGIVRPEELLNRIDPDIVTGFRAQLDESGDVPEDQREEVLFDLLRQYWMR